MFFVLSKTFGFFAMPSNAIAALFVVAALLLAIGWRRGGRRLLAFAVVVLLLVGYSPLSTLLLLPLTERFPAWPADGRAPDGIIVLGGAINPDISAARGSIELEAAGERILAMLQLARRYPQARIVFTGGSANLTATPVPEAPIAGRLLDEFGVAPDRVILESRSRTTDENAVFTRQLVTPKPGERWLLVTSAFHMPRSVGVFRAAGFDVEPYPVDWGLRGWGDAYMPLETLGQGLRRADLAMHEWSGLVAYWLSGKSRELFPGPR
ncbi:YdcF family protein [Bradyrhizobium sp. U87765 SZCCT0131]|uniref:YdcF family protein n=1 Tax=unclassified Bradyrhizobium TaxID=2631580 RepID=UPI001BA8BBFE|nr:MULTISPECIES: YdcF family protein [unclassified Bradyrhizobium]MBR1223254.1 YdcF family protein [Bradyrhizobium sp. U87765 SZCCT0131]MBR1265776.1 YdcF family protein [Bradyrhizobium sp. U87765 SZCCT0134]MBR1309253.1 YdcF family protein [Bradyrhizobium sp. U87765 SZCCT0110]MBR1323168.1 YdcF family protein [Bradyrhizobium sp. U87765 SZCCT0109]MBR1352479.1 YdcF family protein [Bradyrhizobium sp. U87765 SZCCT0048]